MRYLILSILCVTSFFLSSAYAFDDTNDSTVDKADRFDFEDFHKDSAVSIWSQDKSKKDDSTAISTYDDSKAKVQNGQIETEIVTPHGSTNAPSAVTANTPPSAIQNPSKTYDQGQELKVRSAYKLSVDPSQATIPTLFEAIQNLHQQLNGYCPKGWKKEGEWHTPDAGHFYIYYRAACL